MKKLLILTAMLAGVLVLGFSQPTILSGTYIYDEDYYITFSGNTFTGYWGGSAMSGTYYGLGWAGLNLDITGGTMAPSKMVWTIDNPMGTQNPLIDQDGDRWYKESTISVFPEGEQVSPVIGAENAKDVYIAGSIDIGNGGGGGNESYFNACYWKNSARIDLHSRGASDSKAFSITVVGTDVYVSGSCDYRACYWKNGKRTDLSVPARTSSEATSITVVGTDVYIAGNYGEYDWYFNRFSPSTACYWKNGRRTDLSVPAETSWGASASSITVVGTDVYIAGDYDGDACYWKNGRRTDLSGGLSVTYINSITVVGTDVYVAGGYRDGVDYKACYWKNGVKTDLSVPPETWDASARSITVVGTDVYVAGTYNSKPCYWKNGRITDLPSPAERSVWVTGIAVK
jgi:hypothetical protein